ncbi:MAG: DNA translocase FtsK [Defluviitaleaceae bacterium]|nr:DNA translocase FtsK [Defluviitaleaceae bacterium]
MPSTSKRKPAAKGKQDAGRQPQSSPAIRKEIKLIGLVGLGLLLLIAVFIPALLGPAGSFFRGLLIGLFGLGGVFIPIAIIALAVLELISKEVRIPLWRCALLAWVILAWLHVIVNPVDGAYMGAFEYLGAVYRSGNLAAGGLVGGILGGLVQAVAARAGAIIIFSLAIIILLVWITNSSFVKLVEDGARKARDMYEERTARRYEDDDFEVEIPTENPRRAAKKQKMRLKPLAHRQTLVRKDEAKADLIDIDPDDNPEDGDYTVLLVQEDIDLQQEDAPTREVPAFLRGVKKPREEKTPRIVFPGDEFTEARERERLETPEEPAAVPDMPMPDEAPPAADYSAEGIAVDFVYEPTAIIDDSTEAETDADFDEDIHADGDTSVVVKGMVDGAAPSVPPMFDYDQSEDPAAYDEYAHMGADSMDTDTTATHDIPLSSAFSDAPRAAAASPAAPVVPAQPSYENFVLPSLDLLKKSEKSGFNAETHAHVLQNSVILAETLRSFKVETEVAEASVGPTVTRYELIPGPGVKVSSIANLSNDLALALAAQGIRIEAPIPGKSAVGIEIPNKDPQGVFLREILESERFENFSSKLAFAVGKDIAGSPVVADVADMPHLLIAGATGAGKSVCINTLIASILYKAKPDEVKLLMIDPKVVELSVYNGIPHLLIPVVTDPKKASGALNWAVQEMESRYNAFAETGCRDLKGYNRHLKDNTEEPPVPQIVIIIDELADLMMTCKGEVEEAICRLAQKARAAGIHLIVATQRPSVDVITGLIKANIPSRLAFAVSSGTDSRTVLDMQGAEKLLGRGDMLFLPRGQSKPIRVQGGFISDKEVENLVTFLKAQAPLEHTTEMIQQITMPGKTNIEGEVDEFFHDAVEFLLVKGKASTSMLQRQFRIGYNRASRLMEDLEARGIVGPEDGVKPRKVTITREEYGEIYGGD